MRANGVVAHRLTAETGQSPRTADALPASFCAEPQEGVRKPDWAVSGGVRDIPTAARTDLPPALFGSPKTRSLVGPTPLNLSCNSLAVFLSPR